MQLQFGLFDYINIAIFYGVAGTLLLLAWLLLRKWRYSPAVVVPLATVVVVLPWADEVWIAWRFGELCKNAGVHVYKKVEADGYLNAAGVSAVSDIRERIDTDKRIVEEFDKRGFRFVEYSMMGGKVLRSERIDGGVRRAVHDKPLARYHYKHSYQPSPNVYEQPMG